jgi:hypothetical protein
MLAVFVRWPTYRPLSQRLPQLGVIQQDILDAALHSL